MSDTIKSIILLIPVLTAIPIIFLKFIHRTEVEQLFETKIVTA
ncbi:hypothetical protein [Bacillus cereus]|nr:hypothetical protein [Bacillus cereus]